MAAKKSHRFTDKERKAIVQYYLETENYSEVGRKFGCSDDTIKTIVKKVDVVKLLKEKKEQNTKEIVSLMDENKDKVKKIIDRYLDEALDEEKIQRTGLKDLFTAYGIIIDKQYKAEEIKLNKERLKLEREKLEYARSKGVIDDDDIEIVIKRKDPELKLVNK